MDDRRKAEFFRKGHGQLSAWCYNSNQTFVSYVIGVPCSASAWGAQALPAHRLEKAGQSPEQRVHSPCFASGHQTPLRAGPEGKTGSGMSAVVSGFLSGYPRTACVLPGGEDWNGGPWSLFILRLSPCQAGRGK